MHVFVEGQSEEDVKRAIGVSGLRYVVVNDSSGSAHTLVNAHGMFKSYTGHLVVLPGNCPLLRTETIRKMIAAARSANLSGVILTGTLEDPARYGRVIRDAEERVVAIVAQSGATPEVLVAREVETGIYCLDLHALWPRLAQLTEHRRGRVCNLSEVFQVFSGCGQPVEGLQIDLQAEAFRIDDGVALAAVDRLLRARKARDMMLAGVTIENPDTVVIDPGVRIGIDTVLEPGVQILGESVIGESCRLGSHCIIQDSEIDDEARVGPYALVSRSILGKRVRIEPFARLRRDNRLDAGAGRLNEASNPHSR